VGIAVLPERAQADRMGVLVPGICCQLGLVPSLRLGCTGGVVSAAWEIKNQLLDAINDHDLGRVVECYSPDAVLVAPSGVMEGRDQIAWFYEQHFTAFPDLRFTPWCKVPCDDPAVTLWTATGTCTGPFLVPGGGMTAPSGRQVTVRGAFAAHIENGQIITHQWYSDQLEIFSQLGFGLMPLPTA
jgi:hypothetical protein